jgi:predicted nucleotidyltransferase
MPRQTRLQKIMEILRQQRPMLAEQYNVATLEVFGSYVRHEQRKNSDLDILVTFSKPPSLFKFVRLENHLSDILGVKVDLVMKDSLKPAIGKNILREAQPL